jgi:hypothetical protein
MPKISIGRYAPFSGPTLDRFGMKAPEDGGRGKAVKKRLSRSIWFPYIRGQTGYLGLRRSFALR